MLIFSPFLFPPKKRGKKKKGNELAKSWSKLMPFRPVNAIIKLVLIQGCGVERSAAGADQPYFQISKNHWNLSCRNNFKWEEALLLTFSLSPATQLNLNELPSSHKWKGPPIQKWKCWDIYVFIIVMPLTN